MEDVEKVAGVTVEMVEIRYNRQGIRAEVREPRGWQQVSRRTGGRGYHRQSQEGGGGSAHAHTESSRWASGTQPSLSISRGPHFGKHLPWLVRPLRKRVRTPRRQSYRRLLGDRLRWKLGWGRGGCQVWRMCSAGPSSHLRPWPGPVHLAYLAVLWHF